ncbi:hypothetical protein [Tropicibacter oceani]|uniref:Uncharacterized protein n=1 Tax=Tropicibacter oceani TaxID=3058420 RepID=A0ABY8QIH8_9RHOB|nr:hypothetical protein [Tropicibacter oceani]WGW03788.1 hypothetical protein QF118_18015 [Tropicibacter oceani]
MSDQGAPALTRLDKTPLFVERQTYRRRRTVDAARALPVLGLLLWWVPLLWALPERPHSASGALIYIFLVWLGLVVGAGLLILALRRRDNETAPDGPRGGEGA